MAIESSCSPASSSTIVGILDAASLISGLFMGILSSFRGRDRRHRGVCYEKEFRVWGGTSAGGCWYIH